MLAERQAPRGYTTRADLCGARCAFRILGSETAPHQAVVCVDRRDVGTLDLDSLPDLERHEPGGRFASATNRAAGTCSRAEQKAAVTCEQ